MANNNMSMRFRPEGYLSDEEEDSDDGFVFGVEKLDRNANNNRSDQDDNTGKGRQGNSVDVSFKRSTALLSSTLCHCQCVVCAFTFITRAPYCPKC